MHWPKTPRKVDRARQFINAYERLKLEMDKLKKHEDELKFFALEQQCRRVVDGFWRGLPIALYGTLCGHGRYYARPLGILVVVVILEGGSSRVYLAGPEVFLPNARENGGRLHQAHKGVEDRSRCVWVWG